MSQGPKTLLFASIPFEYLADRSQHFAQMGVSGTILHGIMHNWDSDVWLVEGDKIVVGEGNPTFDRAKAMNSACAKNGIDSNFIKVAFYSELPDWFDDNIDTACLAARGHEAAFGSPDGRVFASIDEGETWTAVAEGLPQIRCLALG